MATSNSNNQAGPSRRQAPNPQRNNTLLARIRYHVQALIGQVEVPGKLTHPPTASEKASWNRQASPSGDSEDNYNVDSDVEDPCFPFPGGPGHLSTLTQTLLIMWRTMRKVGIKSFQLDWTKPFNKPKKKFLWDLAFSLFLKLVKAGEYSNTDLEMISEQKIYSALKNHVTNLVKK
ncbi:hypothetical protein PCANC_26701 [Puccinia coronata f. sp. avenae]|uniref:Uncharacterized protein n=1 Tax=Puccinia coronata f. sp. avenae TaxID=200324 RepID=A0A2N5TZM3_9BASI|nr:hypothetical protein PCANC_26701 [Puccinia coronata f. sp. avenae]